MQNISQELDKTITLSMVHQYCQG